MERAHPLYRLGLGPGHRSCSVGAGDGAAEPETSVTRPSRAARRPSRPASSCRTTRTDLPNDVAAGRYVCGEVAAVAAPGRWAHTASSIDFAVAIYAVRSSGRLSCRSSATPPRSADRDEAAPSRPPPVWLAIGPTLDRCRTRPVPEVTFPKGGTGSGAV